MKPPSWPIGPRVSDPVEALELVARHVAHTMPRRSESSWFVSGIQTYRRGGCTLDEALGLNVRQGKHSLSRQHAYHERNRTIKELALRLPAPTIKAKFVSLREMLTETPPRMEPGLEELLATLRDLPALPGSYRQLCRIIGDE